MYKQNVPAYFCFYYMIINMRENAIHKYAAIVTVIVLLLT